MYNFAVGGVQFRRRRCSISAAPLFNFGVSTVQFETVRVFNLDAIFNIDCEYSKMILSTLDGMFKGAINVKTLDEQEKEELEKYWLVTFKREYPKYTAAVIDEVVRRFRENIR